MRLAKRPPHLEADEILIAFAEGNSVTVRIVRRKGATLSSDILMRAVEAISGILRRAPNYTSGVPPLTAADEAVLAEGDPEADKRGASDPVADTAVAYGQLVATSLDSEAAAKRLGVQPSRVRQRVGGDEPTLYAFKYGGSWRIPEFEFEGRALIPGLEVVVPRLPRSLNPVAVFKWFTIPNSDLVDENETTSFSPRDWLRQGRPPEAVAELAALL
jgi:hypothetical protein